MSEIINPEYNIPTEEVEAAGKFSAIYKLLNATTPLEMSNNYTEEDQKLMKSGEWDYDNPDLITNKVKVLLEEIDPSTLSEDEADWRNEVLWFWYHHAISCAVGKNDQVAAQDYAQKALDIQHPDHPNKITRLLYLLVNDKLEEAEEWAKAIDEEPEKSTSRNLIDHYIKERFFKNKF